MKQDGQTQFQCSGDCLKCLPVQRQYCASQHAYNSLLMMKSMQDALDTLITEFEELKKKVSAIQDNEALLFNPSVEDEYIAQEGDGAEE